MTEYGYIYQLTIPCFGGCFSSLHGDYREENDPEFTQKQKDEFEQTARNLGWVKHPCGSWTCSRLRLRYGTWVCAKSFNPNDFNLTKEMLERLKKVSPNPDYYKTIRVSNL